MEDQEVARADAALRTETDAGRRRAIIDGVAAARRPASPNEQVFRLSFLATVSRDRRFVEEIWDLVRQRPFTLEQRYFFYWQLLMRHHDAATGRLALPVVYDSLLAECGRELAQPRTWIPPADRDAEAVVVITNQLLGPRHAPSGDCFDYCRLLQARFGKRVLLVNTGAMPWSVVLPYYEPARFNHEASHARLSRLVIGDQKIDFYQCRRPMPNAAETDRIVRMVQARRPSFVFSLGHSNVAADICAEVVTVASMPFGTNLPRARSNVYVLPRTLRPDDAAFMEEWRITAPQIIETEYTFRLPERSATFTRGELGIPEQAYAIVIVGNRLDQEITDDVAAYLTTLVAAEPRTFLVFMGIFGRYDEVCERHPPLRARSVFLGYQQDVVAVFERCDAFFNPPRYGGGSAAAYAQATGLPVLTLPGGDVANSVGEPFVFESYEAITAFVGRAAADPNVGRTLGAVARARFARISDREAMLRTIVEGAAARAGLHRSA